MRLVVERTNGDAYSLCASSKKMTGIFLCSLGFFSSLSPAGGCVASPLVSLTLRFDFQNRRALWSFLGRLSTACLRLLSASSTGWNCQYLRRELCGKHELVTLRAKSSTNLEKLHQSSNVTCLGRSQAGGSRVFLYSLLYIQPV